MAAVVASFDAVHDIDVEEPVEGKSGRAANFGGGRPLWQYLGLAGLAIGFGGFAVYKAYHSWGPMNSAETVSNDDFNVERAKTMAKLAAVSYCSKSTQSSWSCTDCPKVETPVEVCPGVYNWKKFEIVRDWWNFSTPITERSVYVGIFEGEAILGFAGEHSNYQEIQNMEYGWWDKKEGKAEDWWGDWMWMKESCEDCNVNLEIAAEWYLNRECVKNSLLSLGKAPGSKVRITGHGKGGAAASLAALDLRQSGYEIDELWTFGAPRFGDAKLAMFMTQAFEGHFWRVTRGQDPWVHLPSRYNEHIHPEPEVHFMVDSQDPENEKYVICQSEGDVKCSSKHHNMKKNEFAIQDHRKYMGVELGKGSATMCNDNDGRNPFFGGASGKDSSTGSKASES